MTACNWHVRFPDNCFAERFTVCTDEKGVVDAVGMVPVLPFLLRMILWKLFLLFWWCQQQKDCLQNFVLLQPQSLHLFIYQLLSRIVHDQICLNVVVFLQAYGSFNVDLIWSAGYSWGKNVWCCICLSLIIYMKV